MALLDDVRKLYDDKGLDGLWKWAMKPKGPHGKAKRFDVLARFAGNRKEHSRGEARKDWLARQEVYREHRDKYEKRYQNQHDDADWPKDIELAELLYHNPPHLHVASPERNKLIDLCKVANEKFKCRVGEFPPFDPVEAVHVNGSWHYRDSSQPFVGRNFSNRGDGLAADINDLDGGNDQEFAFYIEVKRRYQ